MSASKTIVTKRQTLLRSTTLVSLLTLLSRIMGFLRDMVLASVFGAQAGMDAFYVAFRIPNFMRRLFAEGAFSQAFVPVLAEYQKTREEHEVLTFIARVAGNLTVVLSFVTIMGILLSPVITFIFAPGFHDDPVRSTLTYEMLRVTFPYLTLVSLTAMAGAVLNTYGYFGVPAITPVLLNICMIFAALYISPLLLKPVTGLAYGVLIAGIAQLLFQLPFLYHRNLLVRPRFVWNDPGVKRVLKLMVPALFGVSVAQMNLMVDTIFASFLKVGSVTWLYYTDRLTDFPLGVFGVAIATVVLPHLSRSRHAEQNLEKFSHTLDWGMRLLLLLGIPAGIGLSLFSMPLIASCFAYGKFSVEDLLQTQKSLQTLAIGVPAFMLVKVLASGFYASQNIKTPVKVGVLAMFANSILCAILIWPLAHAGLTLASSLAGYINCFVLLALLLKRNLYRPTEGWFKYMVQLLVANAIMSGYLWFVCGSVTDWVTLPLKTRLATLLFHVVVAAFIYLGCLVCLGLRRKHFRSFSKKES